MTHGAAAPTAGRLAAGVGRWHIRFLVVGAAVGLAVAVLMPPFRGPDERSHLIRIAQLADGHVVEPLDAHGRATVVIDGCLRAYANANLVPQAARPPAWHLAHGFRSPRCTSPGRLSIDNAAVNAPVAYVPGLAGFALGRALGGAAWGLYGARLAGLLAYLALVALAIRTISRGKAFLFVLGLLPVSLELAGTVSADPVAFGLALLAVALVDRLRTVARAGSGAPGADDPRVEPRGLLAALVLVLLALTLAKNLYADFALLVLLVPARAFRAPARRRAFQAVVIGASLVAAATWSRLVALRVHFGATDIAGVDSHAQSHWIRSHPFSFAAAAWRGLTDATEMRQILTGMSMVSHRVAGGIPAPVGVFIVGAVLLLLALHVDLRPWPPRRIRSHGRHDRLAIVVCLACVAITWVLIEVGVALVSNPVAPHRVDWFQGRYLLPLGPLLVLAQRRLRIEQGADQVRLGWTVAAGSAALLIWYLVQLVTFYY